MPDDTAPPFLTPLQRRLGAAALACVSLLVLVGFAGAMLWLLGKFLTTFSGALWPVILAGLLSFLLQPVCEWFEEKLRLPRTLAILVLYLIVLGLCGLLALIILPVVFHQLTGFIKALPGLWESAAHYAETYFAGSIRGQLEQLGILTPVADTGAVPAADATPPVAPPGDNLSAEVIDWLKSLAGVSLPALARAGTQLQAFFAKVAGLAIIPVYLFYLLAMRRDFVADLRRESSFLPAAWRDDIAFLVRQFIGILVSYFRGQFLIGLILGVLLAVGFTVAGLKFGLLLGLVIGLLNVVPYLGTMLGLGVALPLAYFQDGGGTGTLIAVVVVFIVVQALEGYLITPKIMGKTTGLHPMAIIFSIFFWGLALDGLLGMILAVPLTAFFVVFWRLLKTKYLPRLAETRRE